MFVFAVFFAGVLAYTTYGTHTFVKILAWLLSALLSILIVCSRKHYTVDVVIAWYTVPLMYAFMYHRWTTQRPMAEVYGPRVLYESDDVERDTDIMNDQLMVVVEKATDDKSQASAERRVRDIYHLWSLYL